MPEAQPFSKDASYLVGIDLGTSNCAVAFAQVARGSGAPVTDFPVVQLQRPGETAQGALLPSCLYLPSEHEFPPQATRLAWERGTDWIVGEFARWQGARVPGRFVSSAKSWLCHSKVDRTASILPWGAPADVAKISPVQASALLLDHMQRAWDSAHPEAPLAAQELIITVPASFDEVARALTVSAARQAGLERFTLLEEPQAAFYDFTERHRRDLDQAVQDVRLILVIDVGGGTSDFTLVQVGPSPEGPLLRRIAVGEHLILGGDNMDATLARRAEERMVSSGRRLSAAQWTQLVQAARLAKESLLSEAGPEQYHLSLSGEGSRLLGGTLSAHLTRAEAEELILNGFLPACDPQERPARGSRVALQEVGLPYAHDPAITRHLAAFLQVHRQTACAALGSERSDSTGLPRPDAVLLNGGVFNSPKIAARILAVLASWWPAAPPLRQLEHGSLERAVARGAAYYGMVRRGLGRRITGGAAHALYVGIEGAAAEKDQALCVIPRGQEEGESIDVGDRVFQLTLGRPVRFPLYSSASDRLERAGDVVGISEDMEPLPPIHTVLQSSKAKSGTVAVHLRSALTEIGTLDVWCVSNSSDERWRLEFELRSASAQAAVTVTASMPAHFAAARTFVDQAFGNKPGRGQGHPLSHSPPSPVKEVKGLWTNLEKVLGARETWPVAVLRELWSGLFAGAGRRRRSSEHERIFFQMAGYTLRPGFGYPLDAWRCEQMAGLFSAGIQAAKEAPNWREFWIAWRRIAGGLDESRHQEIWRLLKPHLAHRVPPTVPKHLPAPKGVQPEALDEMVRLGAALEHLDGSEKVVFGDWIAERLRRPAASGGPWTWALGRLGTRSPIYGSAHQVVPADKASEWLALLLSPNLITSDGALFAATQLARLTGDRARDLDESSRVRVLDALHHADAPASWSNLVREVMSLDSTDEVRALGDTLPVGLQLLPVKD